MRRNLAESATADLLQEFGAQVRAIAAAAERRAQLTATAYAQGKRVKVTVNADGAVIETVFSSDIGDLAYHEIAKAVTAAAQQAAREVGRKAEELMAPIAEQRARLPKLSDLLDDLPEFPSRVPEFPAADLTPPSSREHADDRRPTFGNAEDFEQWHADRGAGGVTEGGW